ncbi:hypothetical protein RUM43_005002 [Polyplax serrata]|uniref:Uncharacterized protein n=1 Tax=Polyplax serrata TaxID=468196 RepID=A0AAN8XMT9_POLSC
MKNRKRRKKTAREQSQSLSSMRPKPSENFNESKLSMNEKALLLQHKKHWVVMPARYFHHLSLKYKADWNYQKLDKNKLGFVELKEKSQV